MESTYISSLKLIANLEYITTLRDNLHLIRVPVTTIQVHEDVAKIRGEDCKRESFKKSLENTSGNINPIITFLDTSADSPALYVCEGHQRRMTLEEMGAETTVAIVDETITSAKEAILRGTELNSQRFALKDVDFLSIFSTGLISVAEAHKVTGMSEKNLQRYASVAGNPIIKEACDKGVMKPMVASSLIAKTKDKPDNLAALERKVKETVTQAESAAEKQKLDNARQAKSSTEAKKLEKAKNNVDEDFKAWGKSLDSDAIDKDGNLEVDPVSAYAVQILGSGGWKEKVGITNFEKKLDKWTEDDFSALIGNWDYLLSIFLWAKDHFALGKETPFPDSNPEAQDEVSPEAEEQTVNLK